jgi:hypothetical protein
MAATIVLYFPSEYHNSRQSIIILFQKYLVDIKSEEAWLHLIWEYINRKIVAVQAHTLSVLFGHNLSTSPLFTERELFFLLSVMEIAGYGQPAGGREVEPKKTTSKKICPLLIYSLSACDLRLHFKMQAYCKFCIDG